MSLLCVRVCVRDSRFIMLITGGSLWWLLHAMCPLSWHQRKGMAHTPQPAFTHTLFMCVFLPATGTHSKYNSSCLPPFLSPSRALFIMPANVCIWMWWWGPAAVRIHICLQVETKLPTLHSIATIKYDLTDIQEVKQLVEMVSLFACLFKPRQIKPIPLPHAPWLMLG